MVSIIIINYNTFELTCKCIASVHEYTTGLVYEIILVDNASTECPADLFAQKFPDIILVKSDINLGFSGGNNLGISHANGDHILLLNSDTELLNNAVKIGVDILQNDSTIGCLSGKLVYPDGTPQGVAGRFPSLANNIFELLRVNKFFSKEKLSYTLLGDKWDYSKPVDADWIWGTFFLLSVDVLNKFPQKKLHEDFFMYYEDVLWCYFIKKTLKMRVHYTPEPIILHHLSGSSVTKDHSENYRKKILPNELKFIKKQKGRLYGLCYYLSIAIHQITLRKKANLKNASFYLKIVYDHFILIGK